MSQGASERLSRLLALVPYLLNRQGIPMEQAARDAGITVDQLEKDLLLLFVCGLPGHLPDDLIEADWEDGLVYLGNADTIARPLRLGPEEVATLLVGLRLLAALPGTHDRVALDKAMAKLQEVAGAAAGKADEKVGVDVGPQPDERVLADARRALAEKRRLHLRYYVPGRDETTERDVDPMRLALVDGRTYLEGWCHRAEDVRLFRLDRVVALEVLDVPAEVPAGAVAHDLDSGLFSPSPNDTIAGLELEREALWVTEYYPCDEVTELEDGRRYVRLRSGDPEWMVRLAMRLGPSATLVDPPELAERVRATAAAALEHYAAGGGAV
ncbi:helix-turn-helix transcriptional regulator [Sporichthya polymorpha]|uniref:helix-turn-helix transcriptional regulator n=1 Tax=Sporichthya polymorpha TaxID=35751 RepID=UPI000526A428|nr:WYL domain-containing protein [Sporichthya polymorpha]